MAGNTLHYPPYPHHPEKARDHVVVASSPDLRGIVLAVWTVVSYLGLRRDYVIVLGRCILALCGLGVVFFNVEEDMK